MIFQYILLYLHANLSNLSIIQKYNPVINAYKIEIFEDGGCRGLFVWKTSLIVAQASGAFSEQYIPTAFDDFVVEALVNGKTEMLTLPDADVFIVCYSVDRGDSLKSIREKWIPEIKHFSPNTPIVVVGNKKDIREGESLATCVDFCEAEKLAKDCSTFKAIECSAKSRDNIRTVFEVAIRAAIAHRNRKNNKVVQQLMKLRLVF
uniref:Uncharacterized protein n=1 Tax=Ditylenchus dipsaci TaxID=166011 RepID=A0A915CMR7_9BILA